MPRLAANLMYLFQDRPLEDRFAAAAACGFKAVEVPFPYDLDLGRFGDLLAMNGLHCALINAPAGDWAAGERGIAALAARRDETRAGLDRALQVADFVDCPRVHVMAGVVPEDEREAAMECYITSLDAAARAARESDVTILVEAICDTAIPGYLIDSPSLAALIVEELDTRNLRIEYDLYHAQMAEGGITDFIETYLSRIGHIQVAGVPARNEPDEGELNCRYVFDLLDAHGYAGWVGAEYTPRGRTEDGLAWGRDWGLRRP